MRQSCVLEEQIKAPISGRLNEIEAKVGDGWVWNKRFSILQIGAMPRSLWAF
jgi:hypothetical protein